MPAKKIVIVTGSTAGLGFQCALKIATAHHATHQVVVASRGLSGVKAAVEKIQEQLEPEQRDAVVPCGVPLDLTSLESVKAFSTWAAKEYPTIDSLVLNAGMMSFEITKSKDGFESTFAVNHLGHFYLTLLLLPNILRSDQPRVVVVSSGVHDPATGTGVPAPVWTSESPADWAVGTPAISNPNSAYPFSKLCNVLFAYGLRTRVKDPRLAILVLDPGFCASTSFARDMSWIARAAYENIVSGILWAKEATGLNKIKQLSSVGKSGNVMASLAVEERWVQGNGQGGITLPRYFAIDVERESSVDSYKIEYQKALWEFSEKAVIEKMGRLDPL
ncbi:hypothetical protein BJ742DRAFT_874771 [Cladochytrium replicatum]|nr:hypothetical protein BJ742DRAFT_874771 [Cladochytrium replicatum]